MNLIFESRPGSLRTTVMSKVGDKAENYHFIRMRYGLVYLDIIGYTGH